MDFDRKLQRALLHDATIDLIETGLYMLNFLTRTLFVALLAGASVVSTHASADGDGIISSERPSGQAVALGWEIVDAGRNIEIGEQEYVTLVCTGSIDVEFNSAWTDGSDDNVSGPFQFTAAGRDLTLKIGHSLDETYMMKARAWRRILLKRTNGTTLRLRR